MRIRILLSFAAGLIVASPHAGALAAPQILAVLATDTGIPFTCADGVCEAELSAFCLQRNRPAPDFGTAYVPAAPGVFTLVVTDANGEERRLPAAEHVAFFEHRRYTAAELELIHTAFVLHDHCKLSVSEITAFAQSAPGAAQKHVQRRIRELKETAMQFDTISRRLSA